MCLLLVLSAFGSTTDFIAMVEQWAEWGEYSNIIESVPEFLAATSINISLKEKSVLQKQLGVAYFATGRADEAKNQFVFAWQNDTSVSLDKKLVSNEIYVFFAGAIEAQKKAQSEKAAKSELDKLKVDSERQQKFRKIVSKRRTDFAFFITSLALSGACAAAAAYEYEIAENAYSEFKIAASAGDLARYESHKDDVEDADLYCIASGAGAGVMAVASTVFFIRWIQRIKDCKQFIAQTAGNLDNNIAPVKTGTQ
jgi:hypothetical protein